MIQTANPGETSIPPPPTFEQAGQAARGSAEVAAILFAIGKLLMIATFLRMMKLFGYEFRRRRNRPAHPPAQRPAAARTASKPRRQHKYIDRDGCLALLAQANQAIAAARAEATPPAPPETATLIDLPRPRAHASAPRPPPRAAALPPRRPRAPSSHAPPSQNWCQTCKITPRTTHVQFVPYA